MSETLTIQTDAAGAVVRPGSVLRGVASWTLEKECRSVAIRLFWYTRGKATTVAQIVDDVTSNLTSMTGSRPFEFRLPEGPYSFSGKLITLTWAIELVIDPGARTQRVEFVLSPHDHEIDLTNPVSAG
jgi:hypothetical protein